MKRTPVLPLVALTLLFTLTAAAPPARADTPSPEQRAGELENKGQEAALAGRFGEAASALRAAWALVPSASVACFQPAPERAQPPPPTPISDKSIATSILGGGGGAFIALGLAFSTFSALTGPAAEQASSGYRKAFGPCSGGACGTGDAGIAHSTAQTVAVSGLAIGGGLVTLAGILRLFPQPSAPRAARALSTVAVW